ncbi:MAG: replicative DNA helicase, partial [Anaerolineae bacterium]|nr:replicative DNA helicase [Anaerolineae bacterium]
MSAKKPTPSQTDAVAQADIPQIIEAEEAVLGAIILNPSQYFAVSDRLLATDFYYLRHQYIYAAMQALVNADEPIDYVTLVAKLKENNHLEVIGGGAYLTHLVNTTPTSIHAEAYGNLVIRMAIRRALMGGADEIKSGAKNEELSLDEVQALAERIILDLPMRSQSRMTTMKVAVSESMDMAEAAREGEGNIGIPSWLPELTDLIGGYERDKVYILAGRPGHGKTSFAMRELMNISGTLGLRVGLITLEMGRDQITNDLLAMESRLPGRLIQAGLKNPADWSRYVEVAGRVSQWPVVIDDTPEMTAETLKATALRMKRQYGIDILIVDYMQLMTGSSRYAGNRVQEVSHISRMCKVVAKELHIPVLALAQLSRDIEKRSKKSRRPVLADLRESGQIEQDADVVMFVWQPIRGTGDTLPA